MVTQMIGVRLPVNLVKFLDEYAKKDDRSRTYIITKFLLQKMYELSGDLEG